MSVNRKTAYDQVLHLGGVYRTHDRFHATDFHAQDLAEAQSSRQISDI